MSELLQAIEFHLGRKLQGPEWNYYLLLGVNSDATTEEIKGALKAAAAAWNASDRKSDPARAQKVAQLLREAQAALLDPEKRSAYDQQRGIGISDSEFLAVDPFAAFDPSLLPSQDSYARWPAAKERYASLVAVMEPSIQPTVEKAPWGMSADASSPLPSVALAPGMAKPGIPQTFGSHGGTDSKSSAAARIAALKRKRQRNQVITVSAILVAAAGFLSYAAIRFVASQSRLAKQDERPNVAPVELQREFQEAMNSNALETSEKPTPASDLPPLPSTGEPLPEADSSDSATSRELPSPFDVKPMELPAELARAGNKPAMATMEMPAAEAPISKTPDGDKNHGASKEKWTASMKEAREALTTTDFQAFSKAMETAVQIPMTPEMEAQQKRLDQVGQLYQMAVEAMREARSKTRGTEEISVGKNLVTIVEVTDEAIVVRVAGKNERYNWNQLPLGLALAMSDLTLSDREPTDLAARAVYLSLAPNKTGLYDKKIKEFFDKSLGKGEIRADLPQTFADTYE